MTGEYYVYELVDPRTDVPFYVGKGKGRRIHAHEAEASKGVYSRKCDRIRQIWAQSFKVEKRIVSRHDDENEALQAEFDLITEIGLENLTNVLPGGVIGARVYLAHLDAAQKRKAARDMADSGRAFEQIAPQIAMVLRAKAVGDQVGGWAGDRWLDFTDAYYAIFTDKLRTHGYEFVRRALAPYGVVLKEA